MKTKHTPGPWKITESQADGSPLVVSDEDDVCRVDDINPCGEANANLIAAAPELLSECKHALEFLKDWAKANQCAHDQGYQNFKFRLERAIAKAEGLDE